jgi:RNA polymerase sigma-70 factor (ECF subfamily)
MTDIYQDLEAQIPRLRRYARSLVRDVSAADDLVQETLVRGLAKLHLWQEGTDLRAWLFTILHNQHVNAVRRHIRVGTPVSIEDVALPGRLPDQERGLEVRDLDRALGQLPEGQRAVILLIGLEGMLYVDVATVLGIPLGTVRSRLSRGRNTLRRLMTAEPGKRDTVAVRSRRRETPYPTTPAEPAPSLALVS